MSELVERGQMIGALIVDTITESQKAAPRTQQKTLGLSSIGGCREYLRASIMGDPKDDEGLKWAAYVGTALGDYVESYLQSLTGAHTQETVTVKLLDGQIVATGHLDARWDSDLVDLKTKDGLADVRREGPSFKYQAQLACYFMGCVQMKKLDTNAYAHLVFLDRSGSDPDPYVWTMDWERCLLIIEALEARLMGLATALATGQERGYLRDEPESWCYYTGCPFYSKCWDGYMPTERITNEKEIAALLAFDDARTNAKDWDEIRRTRRDELQGVEGVMPNGWVASWKVTGTASGGESSRFELRKPKDKGTQ